MTSQSDEVTEDSMRGNDGAPMSEPKASKVRPYGYGLPIFGLLGGLVLSGCLAQQADLKQTNRELQKSHQELQLKIQKAKDEIDRMVGETRARLAEEIRSVKEEQLPSLQGDIQVTAHQTMQWVRSQEDKLVRLEQLVHKQEHEQKAKLAALESTFEKDLRDHTAALKQELGSESAKTSSRLDAVSSRLDEVAARLDAVHKTVSALTKAIDARLDEHQKSIAAADARSAALAQQLEAQSKTSNEQAAKFTHALSDFKQGLITLGEEMKQQEQAVKQLSASFEQQTAALSKRTDALAAKVEADTKAATTHINEVNRVMTGHLNEVNRSVSSVAKALETAGEKFAARLDEQDRRLDDISRAVGEVAQVRSQPGPPQQQPSQRPAQPSTLNQVVEQPKAAAEEPGAAASQSAQEDAAGSVEATSRAESDAADINPREVYERVLNKFKAGDLEGARQGFAAFLAEYPNSELAPNARFWLGETYYGKKDFKRAIEAYDHVQLDYPNSEKVPAALLKKGYAYLALKDRKRASTTLRQVIERYPRTPEAGKALDKLNQLKDSR